MEYQAKSKHIEQQLAMLKTEIEGLKVDEKMTPLDHMYTENSLKGAAKYQSLNQVKGSSWSLCNFNLFFHVAFFNISLIHKFGILSLSSFKPGSHKISFTVKGFHCIGT